MRNYFPTLIAIWLTLGSFGAMASELWVSVDADNAETCGPSVDEACNSIQLALNQAEPGDVVLITEGIYREDSSNSPHTNKCTWLDHIYGGLCMHNSGEEGNPIIISAAPGSEGEVVIDSEGERVGIHLMVADYITIRHLEFRNNYVVGIGSWGQAGNDIPDMDVLSIGVRLENNRIVDTFGEYGLNVSGIGMWGSMDWVVRRNYVARAYSEQGRDASCIQAYGVINALVEHNELEDCGAAIFWKDHYIQNEDREKYVESEIRYNRIRGYHYGVQIGPSKQGKVEAGHNYIHHNIISDFRTAAVFGNMTTATNNSGSLHVRNNLIDGSAGDSSKGLSVDSFDDIRFTGNVLVDVSMPLELIRYSDNNYGTLVESDYNIYVDTFRAWVDRYSDTLKVYDNLTAWQNADPNDTYMLGVSNPDSNSAIATWGQVFSGDGLAFAEDSLAHGFMADGEQSAGPYVDDGEEIHIGWPELRPRAIEGFRIE